MEEQGRVTMTENGIEAFSITISKKEYSRLITIAERVSVLERIIERNEYIPVEEIRAIFDIKPVCKVGLKKA